jgi:hypothetical protein
MVVVGIEELLPPVVLKQIGDKLYEKRKAAALEVEQIIKRLSLSNDQGRIRDIVKRLISDFARSPQSNHRKVRVCAWMCMHACMRVGGGGGMVGFFTSSSRRWPLVEHHPLCHH